MREHRQWLSGWAPRAMRVFLVLAVLAPLSLAQGAGSLDELLEQVRRDRVLEHEENQAREQRFLAARDEQQALLEEARTALAELEARSTELQERYQANNRAIAEQQSLLNERMGTLGDLFANARQVASDTRGLLETSLTSAQRPDRLGPLEGLTHGREVPSIEELEGLWHLLLEEMTESGKVVQFPARLITAAGEERTQPVVRVGLFAAASEGKYLRYLPETGTLVELARQPSARDRAALRALERAESGTVPIALDPTRGTLLGLMVQSPGLWERIQQGGMIGYVIMGLGALALLIALERFVVLSLLARRVRHQLARPEPAPDNPLGRVMSVYTERLQRDPETLSLKLDEAILRETPRIRRGLATIAILAAVAPLLGLLGTVTGMIHTFQSITLFGTGDPKLMSGGISLALVTTQQGLAVAIPVLLVHSFLSSRSNRIIQILDEQSAAMVARIAERANGHAP
jgi:biopolymer transport protein ExbB